MSNSDHYFTSMKWVIGGSSYTREGGCPDSCLIFISDGNKKRIIYLVAVITTEDIGWCVCVRFLS